MQTRLSYKWLYLVYTTKTIRPIMPPEIVVGELRFNRDSIFYVFIVGELEFRIMKILYWLRILKSLHTSIKKFVCQRL